MPCEQSTVGLCPKGACGVLSHPLLRQFSAVVFAQLLLYSKEEVHLGMREEPGCAHCGVDRQAPP